jgi:acetyl esterase
MPIDSVWNTPNSGHLDPQAEALLDEFAKRPKLAAPLDDLSYVTALRAGYVGIVRLAGPRERVDRVEDVSANGPSGAIPMRIYRPQARSGGPLVVWFHGGGFVVGDLDTHDAPMRALANRCRCTVLSVAYRLAPEHPYPAGVEDAYASLDWAATHTADIGSDPERIVIGGDSAGGNIATVAAMLGLQRGGFNYPSWKENDGRILDRVSKDRQLAMYLPASVDRAVPHVSPALSSLRDLKGMPPALIVTGEFDPQRDEGELYATRLRDASVRTSLLRYPGMIHGFFQMAGRLAAGRDVIERVAAPVS